MTRSQKAKFVFAALAQHDKMFGLTAMLSGMQVRSGDTEIYYEVRGSGPDLVLLHPFPADQGIWLAVAELLSTRFRVITPDLRGLGRSAPGEGDATMQKHAQDLLRV